MTLSFNTPRAISSTTHTWGRDIIMDFLRTRLEVNADSLIKKGIDPKTITKP